MQPSRAKTLNKKNNKPRKTSQNYEDDETNARPLMSQGLNLGRRTNTIRQGKNGQSLDFEQPWQLQQPMATIENAAEGGDTTIVADMDLMK